MQGKRTDTPTMVSPRRAKAGPSHPLAAIASAVTPIGWAVIAFIIVGLALGGRSNGSRPWPARSRVSSR